MVEEEYKEWSEQLFENVDDCSICPFSAVEGNADIFNVSQPCYGHPDYYMPCQWMEKYKGMTNQEAVAFENKRYLKQRENAEKLRQKRELEEKKKQESIEKRKKTRRANSDINTEIAMLRKRVQKRTEYMNKLEWFFGSVNAVNNLFREEMNNVDVSDKIRYYENQNKEDSLRIEELIKERNRRSRERKN